MISEILHSGEYNYKGKVVLKYEINIPHMEDLACASRFNSYNNEFTGEILKKINSNLFYKSIKQYNIFEKTNCFSPVCITSSVDIMVSTNDYISLFIDVHYDKGAEGLSTFRNSQTWNMKTGKMESLKSLFVRFDWREKLMQELYVGVSKLEQEMGVSCYPEWRGCLQKSLDNDRYYLTAEGIVVFVPQGEIASEIWGIPTFLVEYKSIENILNIYLH